MAKKKKNNPGRLITTVIILAAILILGAVFVSYQNSDKAVTEERNVYEENTREFSPEPKTIDKPVKRIKETTKYVAKCGNREIDLGETCSSCPEDVQCKNGFSCIDAECKEVTLEYLGHSYCGYLRGWYDGRDNRLDISERAIDFFATCDFEGSGSEKAFNRKRELTQDSWVCIDKKGLQLPQEVAVKLDKEYIINRLRVFQKGGNDLFNIREVALEVSIDSTDGQNGHWIPVEIGDRNTLLNSQKDHQDIFFDPVSARWVKLIVRSTWRIPTTHLAVGEIDIFEAKYICDDDFNARFYETPSKL